MHQILSKAPKILTLIIASVLCSAPVSAELRFLDSIAAIVDNDVVMSSELSERVTSIYSRIEQSGTKPPPEDILIPQVLERLIIERIQLAMGRRAGVRITDAELNNAIASIAQNQQLTPEQFLEKTTNQGLSIAVIKEQLMSEIMIGRVQQAQVNRRIFIASQEVDNFLSSDEGLSWSSPDVNLGHILLPLSSAASQQDVEAAHQKAAELLSKLASDEDFRSLAIAYSGDQNALKGGDLGWRKMAELPDIFINALSQLEPGQVSSAIRSDAGIHLLKLYEKRGNEQQLILQSNARHILLKPNEIRNDEDTHALLAGFAKQINEGSDFASMAKEHSEDIGSALSGGELGWSLPGKFVPEFERVLNTIAVNTVSEPFRSQFGWHILQVTERRNQDFSTKIKRNRAEEILRQRKFEEELQIWLQEIRDEAFVEIKT